MKVRRKYRFQQMRKIQKEWNISLKFVLLGIINWKLRRANMIERISLFFRKVFVRSYYFSTTRYHFQFTFLHFLISFNNSHQSEMKTFSNRREMCVILFYEMCVCEMNDVVRWNDPFQQERNNIAFVHLDDKSDGCGGVREYLWKKDYKFYQSRVSSTLAYSVKVRK